MSRGREHGDAGAPRERGPDRPDAEEWEPVGRLPVGCGLAIAAAISALLWIVVIAVVAYLISGRS
jgi:hypothetical protein